MKIFKYTYIAAALLALTAATSCKNEIDDIFDKSAAERIEEALDDYYDILTAAPNGWIMQYFASTEERGYIYYMKFDKNGSVYIATNNEWVGGTFRNETSVFQMIGDDGPVLTFNSYNTLFHIFADPDDVAQWEGSQLGEGHQGDYEFRVINFDKDTRTMTLRGKKRNLEIILTQAPTGISPEQYFEQLTEAEAKMFDSRVSTIYLTTSKRTYVVYHPSTYEISYYPSDGDIITDTQYSTFVATTDGIRFVEPVALDGDTVQNFKLNAAGILECIDPGQTATLSPGDISNMFIADNYIWRVDSESLTGSLVAAYQAVVDESKAKKGGFGQTFRYFQFDTYVESDSQVSHPALSYRNGNAAGHFYLEKIPTATDAINFVFNGDGDAVALRYIELENGDTFTTKAYQDWIALITSTEWGIEANSLMAPTKLTFTSKSNSADSFVVNLQ